MKNLIRVFFVILFCHLSFTSNAQSGDLCHYSTEGTDFWFGLMQNRSNYPDHYLEITVTSKLGADFTLTYGSPEIPIYNITYSVGSNSSKIVRIDYNLFEAVGSGTVENKGIHLVASNPVNVYALNYRTQSSDVAVIYPTKSLGVEYFAMCYSPHPDGSRETNSEFLIVAAEDHTNVTITPSVLTDSGNQANISFNRILNKGQSYQVQSGNLDLTGSSVSSDKPIAFFSGSKATSIPVTGTSYDHLYEQIPPTSTWGREFYMVPLKSRTKDTYRVLAADDVTKVNIEGLNQSVTLNRGQEYDFELSSSQASRLTSNKRVLLAQFCRSQNADGNSGVGDPFMIILSPVTQKINDVTFVAYESALIKDIFYINIITQTSEVGTITLDGINIPSSSSFSLFPNGEYSYAQVSIKKGAHHLKNTSNKGGFLAFVYGFGSSGSTESYGYGVGFNLDIQLDLGGNGTTDTLTICRGSTTELDAGSYFDEYLWSPNGEITSSITVSEEAWYSVTASTSFGCEKTDSLYLKVNDPKINLGNDTSSCGPGKIDLKATNGFESYLWQDGSTNQTFTVDTTGNYLVTGIDEFGCQASDTVHVDVFQVPEVKIAGKNHYCGNFTAELNVEVNNVNDALWNYPGAAEWTSTPDDLEFEDIKPDGVILKANQPGLYTVNYVLTTLNGCQDSDSFQVGFYEIPESTFDVYSPESTDKCSTYERRVKYTGKSGPAAKFNWDFGGLMVLDTIGPNHFKVSIGANNPSRTLKLIVEEHGCKSPETSVTIGVTPTFNFGADQVHGCDELCVQFYSVVTIMDNKVDYLWNFGDNSTSNLQNPIHCYADTGKFDVSLIVTNLIDGCINGSVEKQMIQIFPTPKAVISADSDICYGDTVSFEYLNAKDYSNCKWFTDGNTLLSEENTKATYLLKDEISEVGFLVEENDCSCDTLKVLVKRKPNFDFEVSESEICLPFPVTLKAIPKDQNLQYSWNVKSLQKTDGDSLVSIFTEPGFYSVTLEAFSSLTGCTDALTKEQFIHVYPLPIPGFDQNYLIATLEHPDISFSNQSVGAVRFLWDFGDGTTSTDENPEHKYGKVGEYDVVMEAFTDFECSDTISSKVKIIPFTSYAPNAFRPDSDIPENRIFLPIQEGIDPESYHFKVFSRLGSIVFETSNPEIGWTGEMPNGTKSEQGIYVWIVSYSDVQGFGHSQKGTVMLVR